MWDYVAFLALFTALIFAVAAQSWWRVAKERHDPQQRKELGVHRVRNAALATVVAFWLLAVTIGIAAAIRLF